MRRLKPAVPGEFLLRGILCLLGEQVTAKRVRRAGTVIQDIGRVSPLR